MKIEHISVDVWGTLLKSNPNTASQRARSLIRGLFNRDATAMEIVCINNTYRAISKEIDDYEFRTGFSVPFRRRHELVLQALKINTCVYNSSFYQNEILHFNYLKHKPLLISELSVNLIKQWSSALNKQILVLSNTKYCSSDVLCDVLASYGLRSEIKFIGSDMTNSCKPNLNFYKEAYLNCNMVNVLHIGDSTTLDINPVKALNGNTYQIKSAKSWEEINIKL